MSYSIYSSVNGENICRFCGIQVGNAQYHQCHELARLNEKMPSAKFSDRNPAPPSSVSPSSSPSVKAYQNNSDTLRSNNNREGARKKTFKRMSNYATLTLNSSSDHHQQYQRPADTREYAGYDDILSPDIYDDDYYGDDAAANYYNNSADRRKQQQQPDIARKPSNGGSSSGGGGGGYLDDIMKGISGLISTVTPEPLSPARPLSETSFRDPDFFPGNNKRRSPLGNQSPPPSPRHQSPSRPHTPSSPRQTTPSRPTTPSSTRHHQQQQQHHYSSSPRSRAQSPRPTPSSPISRTICLGCRAPLHPSEDFFEIAALNGSFHPDCFVCRDCGCDFDEQRPYVPVPWEQAAYCEAHFSRKYLSSCAACLKPITDDKISFAFGRAFHSKHLRCHTCKHRIRGPHVEHNGKAYCEKDSPLLNPPPSPTTATSPVSAPSCTHCSLPILAPTVPIQALNSLWHPTCFLCTTCHLPFPSKKFYVHAGKPYCLPHFYQASNSLCRGCNDPIQGVCTEVPDLQNARFHEECWRCGGDCGEVLGGVYYSYRGLAYCERDMAKVYKGAAGGMQKRHTLRRGG